MQTKSWIKTGPNQFRFVLGEREAGQMDIDFHSLERKATVQMGPLRFTIRRTGFWRSNLEIRDGQDVLMATLRPEKWYASAWILEYNQKQYRVHIRNKPLAEYVILDGSEELASYGLKTDAGKISVGITHSPGHDDPFFDALLWYLFMPIATENLGDDLSLLLLVG